MTEFVFYLYDRQRNCAVFRYKAETKEEAYKKLHKEAKNLHYFIPSLKYL